MLFALALEKWGKRTQMLVLCEECAELQKDILKWLRPNLDGADKPIEDFRVEELADVEIMLEQVTEMLSSDQFAAYVRAREEKLSRLEERLMPNVAAVNKETVSKHEERVEKENR